MERVGFPARVATFFFEVIMRSYERKSTMMTSNRPLEDWGKLVGDVPAASANLDRLLIGFHSYRCQVGFCTCRADGTNQYRD
jgi:DNA replication protein DnaC